MIALVLAALTDLTRELLRAFPPPDQCAAGSSPAIVVRDKAVRKTLTPAARARLDAVVDRYRPMTPGLVTCPKCGTSQRPMAHRFAVHFPTLTSARPCAGSWP